MAHDSQQIQAPEAPLGLSFSLMPFSKYAEILLLANKSDFKKRKSSADEKEWGGDSYIL